MPEAPALGLTDMTREFNLFVYEKREIAMTYSLFVQAVRWSPCLWAKEVDKLTVEKSVNFMIQHATMAFKAIEGTIDSSIHKWATTKASFAKIPKFP